MGFDEFLSCCFITCGLLSVAIAFLGLLEFIELETAVKFVVVSTITGLFFGLWAEVLWRQK